MLLRRTELASACRAVLQVRHVPPDAGTVPQPDAHVPNCEEEVCKFVAAVSFYRRWQSYFTAGQFWDHGVGNIGAQEGLTQVDYNRWSGAFFGLFREPSARLFSAWSFFRGASFVNSTSYARQAKAGMTLQLQGGEHGLHCTMPGNFGLCHPPRPDLTLALSRLRGFAFVGLTDAYPLSVCLFHLKFGTPCLPVEFLNSRPTNVSKTLSDKFTKGLAQGVPFGGCIDQTDEALYLHVRERFMKEVANTNATPARCAQICPYAQQEAFALKPRKLRRPLAPGVKPC